jgi:lipoyl(octanoyl) transferase
MDRPVDQPVSRIAWKASTAPVPYPEAVAFMERHVGQMAAGKAGEMVWLLEHPALYTAGTSAKPEELLDARFPVFPSGRGGQYTYHGPGQRVAYVMLDLKKRGLDVRDFVHGLEQWVIESLRPFGVTGERREGRIGVWVKTPEGDAKIAAIGVRVRKWITYHGIAINVAPDLTHFSGIVPCGITDAGVTSLKALGNPATLAGLDQALKATFEKTFRKPC